MRAGVVLTAVCLGLFIGAGESPEALTAAAGFAVFTGGQYWAYKRYGG
jgi:hypothetical protein